MGKYKLDKSAQVVGDTNYTMTQEEVCEKLNNLEDQLALTEKALELACETIKSMCPRPLWIGGTIPAPEVKDAEYFKEIAKENNNG